MKNAQFNVEQRETLNAGAFFFLFLFFRQFFPSGICTANHLLSFDVVLLILTLLPSFTTSTNPFLGLPSGLLSARSSCQSISGGKIYRLHFDILSCGHIRTASLWPLRPHIHCPSDVLNTDPVLSTHSQKEAQHFCLCCLLLCLSSSPQWHRRPYKPDYTAPPTTSAGD